MPRLMRFYGGDPVAWLTRTPVAVVRACIAMLPRLQAEESMQAAESTAVGSGVLKRESSRQIARRWQRSVSGVGRIAKRRKPTRAELAFMGIEATAGGESS